MKTVAILPGIFSGPLTTRQLRRYLVEAGYRLTTDMPEADIVLAHSAGPLWLPRASRRQTIVLVNPPYWPGKTIRERARSRSRSNLRFRERGVPVQIWLMRQIWGIYYALRNPHRTYYVMRHMAAYDLPQAIQDRKVILVRNELDDWLTPQLSTLQRSRPNLTVVNLPGDHDDFNYNPKRYVELLQSHT